MLKQFSFLAIKKVASIIFFVMLIPFCLNANNFYSVGNGNWHVKGTWQGNSAPTYTISVGDTVFVNYGHSVNYSNDITLYGVLVIDNGSVVSDNGQKDIIVKSTGKIIVIGRVEMTNLSNEGTIDLQGELEVIQTSAQTSSIINTGTINISTGGNLNSTGIIENIGTINNEGTLDVNGEMINTGTVNNDGYMEVDALTVTSTGTLNNTEELVVNGDFVNDGNVSNTDQISVGGNFENTSSNTLTNTGDIVVDGDLINTGTINNDGNLFVGGDADSGGDINGSGSICGQDGTDPFIDPYIGDNVVCGNGGLPISLLYLKGRAEGDFVVLDWATATEMNNDFFTIERSFDNQRYTKIAAIKGAGDANKTSYYSYRDRTSSENDFIYYRLRQTDFDGRSTVSQPIAVSSMSTDEQLLMFPNPCSVSEDVVIYPPYSSSWELTVYESLGNIKHFVRSDQETLLLNTSGFPRGLYIIVLSDGNVRLQSKLIIR